MRSVCCGDDNGAASIPHQKLLLCLPGRRSVHPGRWKSNPARQGSWRYSMPSGTHVHANAIPACPLSLPGKIQRLTNVINPWTFKKFNASFNTLPPEPTSVAQTLKALFRLHLRICRPLRNVVPKTLNERKYWNTFANGR